MRANCSPNDFFPNHGAQKGRKLKNSTPATNPLKKLNAFNKGSALRFVCDMQLVLVSQVIYFYCAYNSVLILSKVCAIKKRHGPSLALLCFAPR
jgi:hypothetical protein